MGAHISVPLWQRTIKSRYRLQGSKCRICGNVAFPPHTFCPTCQQSDCLQPLALSGKGRVESYTFIRAGGTPPEFTWQSRVQEGYIVALIKLEEGPSLVAQLVNCQPEEVSIGMPVHACLRKLYEEEGVIRYCYKFIPDERKG
ncbi:MAG: Zn-ribbon domain-containing OB-fold protein [Firmicutes bacterium]|nr:Zn-ribbon domain-containing OB-fold protein [Bacillota bacterium]